MASADAEQFGPLLNPVGSAGTSSQSTSTHSSASTGNDQPGQPLRSHAWLGPVLLDSLQGYLTVGVELPSPLPSQAFRSTVLLLPLLSIVSVFPDVAALCDAEVRTCRQSLWSSRWCLWKVSSQTRPACLSEAFYATETKGLGGSYFLVAKRKGEQWTILDQMPTFSTCNKTSNSNLSCYKAACFRLPQLPRHLFSYGYPAGNTLHRGWRPQPFQSSLVLICIFIISLVHKYICTG